MSETRRCPSCRKEKPRSEFGFRKDGRTRAYCRPCDSARKRSKPKSVAGLSPAEIFAAYPRSQPANSRSSLNKDGRRICRHCLEWKAISAFRAATTRGRVVVQYTCKACAARKTQLWRKAHPDAERSHRKNRKEKEKIRRRFLSQVFERRGVIPRNSVDTIRRLLIDSPQVLQSENSLAAYARGFFAGAKRTEIEGERFERLKDLCHRIAAEKGYGFIYEERLAAAYEGLLAFIRKRKEFKSHSHERNAAAVRIRGAIVDQVRADGPVGRSGNIRYQTLCASELAQDESEGSIPENLTPECRAELPSIELPTSNMDERTRSILEDYAAGYTQIEIGRKLGITAGRVCQIMKNVGKTNPELERHLEMAV